MSQKYSIEFIDDVYLCKGAVDNLSVLAEMTGVLHNLCKDKNPRVIITSDTLIAGSEKSVAHYQRKHQAQSEATNNVT